MPSDGYAIIVDESRRLLDRQERGLDELRGRAAALLAVGSVAAGLLGAPALKAKHLALVAYLALAFFAGTAGAVLFIIWPRDWNFDHRLDGYIKDLDAGKPTATVARDLALHLQQLRESNAGRLRCLANVYAVGCALLAGQVVLWSLSLVA